MCKDERIHELVLPECDIVYSNHEVEKWERCTCGSSIVRIFRETIVENKEQTGNDYTIVCAKCGCHVFGLINKIEKKKE